MQFPEEEHHGFLGSLDKSSSLMIGPAKMNKYSCSEKLFFEKRYFIVFK